MNKITVFLLTQLAIILLLLFSFFDFLDKTWILVFIMLVIFQMVYSFKNIELLVGLSVIINIVFFVLFLIPYLGVVFKGLYIFFSLLLMVLLLVINTPRTVIFQKVDLNGFNSNMKNKFKKKQFKNKSKKSKFEDSTTQDVQFEEK